MKQLKLFALFCILFSSSIPLAVAAPPADLSRVVATLEYAFGSASNQQTIRDFTANFLQQAHIASLDRIQEGKGKVWVLFRSSAAIPSFRWEYGEPTPQLIVSDGTTISVYLPENRQVMVSEVKAFERAEDPLLFLTGLGRLREEFVISEAKPWQDRQGDYLLELVPKKPSPYFERIQVKVSARAVAESGPKAKVLFPLLEVTVFDTVGNTTKIAFEGVKTNSRPDPGLFRFEPPAGVEVVRPESHGGF